MNIAIDRFTESIYDLLAKANPFGFGKILFVVGNDFFQSDTPDSETTAGTRVDTETLNNSLMLTLGFIENGDLIEDERLLKLEFDIETE